VFSLWLLALGCLVVSCWASVCCFGLFASCHAPNYIELVLPELELLELNLLELELLELELLELELLELELLELELL
jgi:hypothetical protein